VGIVANFHSLSRPIQSARNAYSAVAGLLLLRGAPPSLLLRLNRELETRRIEQAQQRFQ